MTVDEKRKLELKTMYQIIGIYCHNKHHTPKGQLCEACEQSKTFCSVCKTHCYAPNYREKIREIMRYGGPRMLLVSPIQVIRHMYLEWKDKKRG
ncbi:MAG: nitrous oxide-stimulated promoter family protein [Veillonella sp.]|nr:nitrous oxide-stimulated promoter family protein [Veillonella sp.]